MAIHVRNNFCVAPFTQITFTPSGKTSPCPEIGGRIWANPNTSLIKIWRSDDFENLRQSFINNEKNPICNRCWSQEDHKAQSLRRRLFLSPHLKENLLDFIEHDISDGPRQMNLITSNLCNLRCRICDAGLSVTYNVEGRYYEEKNNIAGTKYVSKIKSIVTFSDSQIEEMFSLSKNLRRLEFYGGEPLLDKPTLKLLQMLVDADFAKNITLFYNTNGVCEPTEQHYTLWNHFKSIEFNFSIDAINEKFTYNRHPAKWEDALSVINKIRNYPWSISVSFYAFCTTSAINIYDLPETIAECEKLGLPFMINNVYGPDYYNIESLPVPVKLAVLEHLEKYPQYNKYLGFIKNILKSDTPNDQWANFVFWTKEKDAYRKESFKQVMPEYYKILHNYDNQF